MDTAPSSRQTAALGELLDTVRAMATGTAVPRIVLAGASGTEPVTAIVAGLLEQASERGLRVFVGRLAISRGQRLLTGQPIPETQARTPRPTTDSDVVNALTLDLAGAPEGEDVAEWMRAASHGQDLVLVEAPPVCNSVEAPLLANRADGLVIVVEPMTTRRRDLEVAVERCESAGSRLLGLVSCAPDRSFPTWLRSLFKAS